MLIHQKYILLWNPNITVEELTTLSGDKDSVIRGMVAGDNKTPIEILKNLSRDKDKTVRKLANIHLKEICQSEERFRDWERKTREFHAKKRRPEMYPDAKLLRWTNRLGNTVEWGNNVMGFRGQAFRETFNSEEEAIERERQAHAGEAITTARLPVAVTRTQLN